MIKTFKNDKLKKIGKIANNTILVGSLIGAMITSPLCLNTINKNTSIDDILTSLFENQNDLCIQNNCNAESFDTNVQYNCVTIKDTTINDMSFFNDLTIDTIVFENCDLRNCKINLPSSVTSASFTNCNINNFNGLDNNKDIYYLYMDSCNVGGLDGIEKLENLESLVIAYVGIENIDNLADLNNLKNLTLLQTCIKSIEPLRNSNIESLDISDSLNLTDISAIKDMNNLQNLYGTNCQMCLDDDVLNYINNSAICSNFSKDDLKIKQQVKTIANNIFNDSMTDKEKIDAAVDYIVNNMEYDNNGTIDLELLNEYNANALKYALQGTGCCRNYTAITTALLQEANINIYEVLNDGHIWSQVVIEDDYYWLDSTLIDLENYENFTDSNGYMTLNFNNLNSDDPCSVPESYYNKTNNIEQFKNTNSIDYTINYTSDITDTTNKHKNEQYDIINRLHIPLGALVGIAVALKLGFKAKKKDAGNKNQQTINAKETNVNQINNHNINTLLIDLEEHCNENSNLDTQTYKLGIDNLLDEYGFGFDEKEKSKK